MTPDEERASYQQSIETIPRATGTRPVGLDDSARSVSTCDVSLMKGFSRAAVTSNLQNCAARGTLSRRQLQIGIRDAKFTFISRLLSESCTGF
jgi:hypothetical protein